MARPKKQTVDYFPHFVKCGRTIFILESKFGNDGYAFWFKVLEILGESEGHFYDCSNVSSWEFLLAKTRVTEDKAKDIISVLIDLGKIDAELWEKHRVLWIGNFTRNLSEVYRTRHTDLPSKPCFQDKKQPEPVIPSEETTEEETFSPRKPAKGEESKEKESKEKYPYQDICALWNSVCLSLPKVQKVNDNRRHKIKCRCDEWGKNRETWLQTAEALFRRVQASDFLTGRQSGKASWTASFDWLFNNDSNWVKVSEGNYDNDRGGRGGQAASNVTKVELGVGEFYDNSGRRTYGSGKATIPPTAPPRPSDRHAWDSLSNTWILL